MEYRTFQILSESRCELCKNCWANPEEFWNDDTRDDNEVLFLQNKGNPSRNPVQKSPGLGSFRPTTGGVTSAMSNKSWWQQASDFS